MSSLPVELDPPSFGDPQRDLLPPPEPGDLLASVQLEWDALDALGAPAPPDLPRPWIPSTCTAAGLHAELVRWLSEYVDWLNDQHAWDPDDHIPACWARHPHLVHDLAVLADQHRRASNAATSGPLEQWHRLLLPAFHDRRQHTIRQHCTVEHRRLTLA